MQCASLCAFKNSGNKNNTIYATITRVLFQTVLSVRKDLKKEVNNL